MSDEENDSKELMLDDPLEDLPEVSDDDDLITGEEDDDAEENNYSFYDERLDENGSFSY